MSRIQKLTLKHFRGATQSTEIIFDEHKPVALIFGENGAGKSSIIDALDVVCNKYGGSVRDRSSTNTKDHLPSIGRSFAEVEITLQLADQQTWSAYLDGGKIKVSGETPPPELRVLRRSQLLKLIEARPKERYQALSQFIDVAAIEKSEEELNRLKISLSHEFNSIASEIILLEEQMEKFWKLADSPEKNALDWAEKASEDIKKPPESSIAMQKIKGYQLAQITFEKLQKLKEKIEEKSNTNKTNAQQHLVPSGHSSHKSTSKASENVDKISNSLQENVKDKLLLEIEILKEDYDYTEKEFKSMLNKLKITDPYKIQNKLDDYLDIYQEVTQIYEMKKAVDVVFQQYRKSKQKALNVQVLRENTENILNYIKKARKEYVTKILAKIINEINDLYQRIHPNEKIGMSGLSIHPKTKGSLHHKGSFADQDNIVPQAYLSEAHLDTLGFCYWMALAKIDNTEQKILVLDDVFSSVDAAHIARINELLLEESKHFRQIVIATHYKQWREYFRYTLGPAQNTDLIELNRWTLQHGIIGNKNALTYRELTQLLEQPVLDRQSVADKSGVLLDMVLDALSLQLRVSMLRKPNGQYTLGELLESIKKHCNDKNLYIYHHHTATGITGLLEDLLGLAFIKNQVGSQFGTLADDTPSSEVERFGYTTLQLLKALTCPECENIPRKKERDYFRCSCKATKLVYKGSAEA